MVVPNGIEVLRDRLDDNGTPSSTPGRRRSSVLSQIELNPIGRGQKVDFLHILLSCSAIQLPHSIVMAANQENHTKQ